MVDKIPSNKISGVNQAGKASAPKTTDSNKITPETIAESARNGVPASASAQAIFAVLEFVGHRKAA